MPYWRPWLVSSIAHIHQLLSKVEGIVLSTMVHIILKASSGVAAKLWAGSQPIPSKLTDKIEDQATPNNPGSVCKISTLITLLVLSIHHIWWYHLLISKKIPWTIPIHTNKSIRNHIIIRRIIIILIHYHKDLRAKGLSLPSSSLGLHDLILSPVCCVLCWCPTVQSHLER
jgi:hypothetical protein